MHDDLNARGINKKWSPMQRYNNDFQQCPRGEIGRHKGLKIV